MQDKPFIKKTDTELTWIVDNSSSNLIYNSRGLACRLAAYYHITMTRHAMGCSDRVRNEYYSVWYVSTPRKLLKRLSIGIFIRTTASGKGSKKKRNCILQWYASDYGVHHGDQATSSAQSVVKLARQRVTIARQDHRRF